MSANGEGADSVELLRRDDRPRSLPSGKRCAITLGMDFKDVAPMSSDEDLAVRVGVEIHRAYAVHHREGYAGEGRETHRLVGRGAYTFAFASDQNNMSSAFVNKVHSSFISNPNAHRLDIAMVWPSPASPPSNSLTPRVTFIHQKDREPSIDVGLHDCHGALPTAPVV